MYGKGSTSPHATERSAIHIVTLWFPPPIRRTVITRFKLLSSWHIMLPSSEDKSKLCSSIWIRTILLYKRVSNKYSDSVAPVPPATWPRRSHISDTSMYCFIVKQGFYIHSIWQLAHFSEFWRHHFVFIGKENRNIVISRRKVVEVSGLSKKLCLGVTYFLKCLGRNTRGGGGYIYTKNIFVCIMFVILVTFQKRKKERKER